MDLHPMPGPLPVFWDSPKTHVENQVEIGTYNPTFMDFTRAGSPT